MNHDPHDCYDYDQPKVSQSDISVLDGAVKIFEELATGANPHPLAIAQSISRVADALRAAGGLHYPADAELLAAVALSATPIAGLLEALIEAKNELYHIAHSSCDPDSPDATDSVACAYRACRDAIGGF